MSWARSGSTQQSDNVNQTIPKQKIYLSLTPDMQRELPASLERMLAREGVQIPAGIELSQEALPGDGSGVANKDIGVVVNITLDPATIAALGSGAVAIILAISRFLKDRSRAPRLVTVQEVVEVTGEDGQPRKVLVDQPRLLEPGPELKIELEAQIKKGGDASVALKYES